MAHKPWDGVGKLTPMATRPTYLLNLVTAVVTTAALYITTTLLLLSIVIGIMLFMVFLIHDTLNAHMAWTKRSVATLDLKIDTHQSAMYRLIKESRHE